MSRHITPATVRDYIAVVGDEDAWASKTEIPLSSVSADSLCRWAHVTVHGDVHTWMAVVAESTCPHCDGTDVRSLDAALAGQEPLSWPVQPIDGLADPELAAAITEAHSGDLP